MIVKANNRLLSESFVKNYNNLFFFLRIPQLHVNKMMNYISSTDLL